MEKFLLNFLTSNKSSKTNKTNKFAETNKFVSLGKGYL